jgi:pimeloyl-ACP methyl ester carboxylesterase
MGRLPILLALPAAAIGGLLIAGRRMRVSEDLEWESIDKPGKVVTIDGYHVHYEEMGRGPAFIMVHGFGGSTYQYRELMPAFASTHRCIAVDLKGFGYSQRREDTGMSHDDQARMLAGLMDELGVSTATLIGHSMGGGVVQRFAALFPERADAIILAASVTGDERRGRGALTGATWLLRPILPVLAGFAGDRLFAASFHDKALATRELRDIYMRPARLKGSMDGLMRMVQDSAHDAPIDYGKITMPVLVLNAAQDRVVPLAAAQKLRERIPHARIVVIDQAGHLLFEEQPAECVSAITGFLAEAAKQRAGTPVAAG